MCVLYTIQVGVNEGLPTKSYIPLKDYNYEESYLCLHYIHRGCYITSVFFHFLTGRLAAPFGGGLLAPLFGGGLLARLGAALLPPLGGGLLALCAW